ncbi:MAG: Fe-S-containing protein [Candidatus Hodarchaeota archaeon]
MKELSDGLENDNEKELTRTEARILEKNQNKGNWSFVKAIIIISVVIFTGIVLMQSNNGQDIIMTTQEGDKLVIQVSSLTNNAKFYGYKAEDTLIKFFGVMGFDNDVHVAFDACDVCYSDRKGYVQDNTVMVCRNCGNQFLIDGIGTENLQGGCWPSYLPINVINDQVYIKISDVIMKKYMFQ